MKAEVSRIGPCSYDVEWQMGANQLHRSTNSPPRLLLRLTTFQVVRTPKSNVKSSNFLFAYWRPAFFGS
jgi:hypothetical protein